MFPALSTAIPLRKLAKLGVTAVDGMTSVWVPLLGAMARFGPPRGVGQSNALVDVFVDANLAASVLDQPSGQATIPADVLSASEPDDSGADD